MKNLLLLLFLVCLVPTVFGQQFPVESQVVVRPPSSVYLSDFTEPGSQRLDFLLDFRDSNEPEYDVRLHLKLEGNGVVLETSPNYQPPPITLFPDGPRSLDMIEWADYLDPANLTLIGLDQMTFLTQGGKLPEGIYNLCLTVRDFRRPDVNLSRENCRVLNLRKNNPPLPFVPTCGGVVQPTPNNQVQLSWQANHDALVNAQYTIDMVRVEPSQDPNQAIISGGQRLLPDVVINNQTSYTIDPSVPSSTQLVYGETYAYRINVIDLDGLTTFENDGQGEVCWFTYGFLPGGQLGVNYPQQDNRVRPADPLVFRWNGPTNATAGTNIYYQIRVADVTNGADPAVALSGGSLLIDEQTQVTSNLGAWNFPYDGELETERTLAWSVAAYVDGSEGEEPLAESEVVTFTTTPLIDRFRAGQYTVFVNTAGNSTLQDFSGTGTVRVNNDLELEVAFQNLVLEEVGTNIVLSEGLIDVPLDEEWPLENPDGGSFFLANRLLLDRDNLNVEGRVQHHFGLPGTSVPATQGGSVKIQSPELQLSFEGGVMSEGSGTFENIDIKPLDLPGLTIAYRDISYQISNGAIDYVVKGTYQLDGPVTWMDQQQVELPIENHSSFYDQTLLYNGTGIALKLTRDDEINLLLKEVVVDLRYDESTPGSEQDEFWVGFFVKEGGLSFPTDFDADEAIIPLTEVSIPVGQFDEPTLLVPKLNLSVNHTFTEEVRPRASFYSFLDDWHELTLTIEAGSITVGQLDGDVLVPFLDDETPFTYSVSITEDGSEAAWLNSIDDFSVEFEGRDLVNDELTITVLGGAFAGTDRLVLNTEVYFSAFDATLTGFDGLTLWGDGSVGFDGVRHGIKNASDHVEISVNNFPGNLKSFGVSYQYATETQNEDQAAPEGISVWDRRVKYLFVYEAEVSFGMFLSSLVPGNAPKTSFGLSTYRDISVLLPADYSSDLEPEATTMPDEWTDLWEAQQEQEEESEIFSASEQAEMIPFLVASVATSAIPGIANVTVGKLKVVPNDPDWGAFFALKSEIEVQRPFLFRIQVDVFAGHTPGTEDDGGYAFTMVKIGLKDGTEGFYQNLDNHLAMAKTRQAFTGMQADDDSFAEGSNLSKAVQVGPINVRYLALGVYINMDYDGGGNLVPTQGSYGGLLSLAGRMNIPPNSEGLGEGLGGELVGKRRIQIDLTCELIISTSLGPSYVYARVQANYTEGVNTSDPGNGGNYLKIGLEGSYDWGAQILTAGADFDLWYPPICVVANAGVDFQLYPESGDLRTLNIRLGSYDNRITIEYCQAVEAGAEGSNSASIGYSYGAVLWLNIGMRYGLPVTLLPEGFTSYASFDEDLAHLDEQMALLDALPDSEQAIIETALSNPDDLPDGITNDPDFGGLLIGYEQTYATKIWSGEIGLGLTASVEARMNDWIDLGVIRFIPFVTAEAQLVGWGNVQITPIYVVNEIGIELAGTAQIGAYYEQLDGFEYTGNVQTWVAADISLMAQGILDLRNERIYGSLAAQIQLISLPTGGYLVDFAADVPYDFSIAD